MAEKTRDAALHLLRGDEPVPSCPVAPEGYVSAVGQRALTLDIGDQRWALQGGWEEDGVLGLRFAVVSGDDVAEFSARIPITTDGETLELGEAVISEGWPE